jgi:hypothetical protein
VWKGRVTNFWLLQAAGWLVYWLLIFMTFWTVIPEGGAVATLAAIKLVRAAIGFGLSSLLRPVYRSVTVGASPPRLVALVVGCSAVFGCAWTLLEAVYGRLAFPQFDTADWLARSPRVALDYAVTLLAWSALYLGLKYWGSWREARESALRSEALAQKARLEALRYQLNPHFLFNSLTSLRALIDEDPSRARRMVTELAEFMRHALVRDGGELTPLGDEVETIENYLSIEKARFEEKLDVVVDVDPAAREWLVPPFLLHPLVENAVKHGMRTSPMPLRVELRARAAGGRLTLEVGNTGAWQGHAASDASGPEGTGTGLSNVRARLEQLYPGRHRLSVTREAGRVSTVVEIEREGGGVG